MRVVGDNRSSSNGSSLVGDIFVLGEAADTLEERCRSSRSEVIGGFDPASFAERSPFWSDIPGPPCSK